jgi:HD-like signal output (HDOD) protein
MNALDLQTRLSKIEDLPALPLVLQQVQKIMNNPKSNMGQIASVMAKDQALASKTIKLVNSAFYGISKPVSSITQAIVILGLNTVNNLMLGLSAIKIFKSTGAQAINHEEFWEHAFATALISRSIGKLLHFEEPEDCFTAGLLHDMGRLIFEQHMHKEFMEALAVSNEKTISLSRAEQLVLGADHAFAGGYLAKKWKLPAALITPITFHHSIGSIPEELAQHVKITAIVAKASQTANKQKLGNSRENYVEPDSLHAQLGIAGPDLESIVSRTKSEIKSAIQEWYKK